MRPTSSFKSAHRGRVEMSRGIQPFPDETCDTRPPQFNSAPPTGFPGKLERVAFGLAGVEDFDAADCFHRPVSVLPKPVSRRRWSVRELAGEPVRIVRPSARSVSQIDAYSMARGIAGPRKPSGLRARKWAAHVGLPRLFPDKTREPSRIHVQLKTRCAGRRPGAAGFAVKSP